MLAALGPSVVKVFDAAVQRWVVPDKIKPATVAEAATLAGIEIERLRIATAADSAGETYKWVEALRKLQRPVVVYAALFSFLMQPDNQTVAAIFQVVMWYLFGERLLLKTPQVTK